MLTVLLIALLILVICKNKTRKLTIDDVKNGYLISLNNNMTIGEAFEKYAYFESVDWQEFKGSNDEIDSAYVVELTAKTEMYEISSSYFYDDSGDGYIT